jgi:predicted ATPase
MMFRDLFIEGIKVRKEINQSDSYISSLPVVKNLLKIEMLPLTRKVTFFVGENGTGKSTLLEAIAVSFGFNAEGGTRNFNFATEETHSDLYQFLTVCKGIKRPKDGFFARRAFITLLPKLKGWMRSVRFSIIMGVNHCIANHMGKASCLLF